MDKVETCIAVVKRSAGRNCLFFPIAESDLGWYGRGFQFPFLKLREQGPTKHLLVLLVSCTMGKCLKTKERERK